MLLKNGKNIGKKGNLLKVFTIAIQLLEEHKLVTLC